MKNSDYLRRDVAKAYTKAVRKPSGKGCCCGGSAQKGVVAKLGGYSAEQLAALPAEAVINSFGCGNPVAMAGLKLGDVVIDLGSGAGIDLFLAAKKVGPSGKAIGIDMTDEMIAKAGENIQAGGFTNVQVRKGIIEQLPIDDASADWVISNCVINLSPEKERVFAEIARVLKPGGQMLVSDIVAEDLPESIRRDPALYASCIAGAISEQAYVAGLQAAGLAGVEVKERLVYDESQLEAFFGSELEGCCGAKTDPALMRAAAKLMVGKVWSAKIYARKPH